MAPSEPRHPAFDALIGSSPNLLETIHLLAKAAASDAPVLIVGETGTGKELAARGLHDASPRSRRPFVAVNCAAIAPSLLESELFGHVKGSFSGAERNRAGLFQSALGGTLFLDEIGELRKDHQTKLLRVLQEREVRRVGSNATEKVDVRIVAASNRDLERAVVQGEFRQDLFYRLKGMMVVLPPLRERTSDIPLLAQNFLHRLEKRFGSRRFESKAMARLIDHGWPGNVRELERTVEALVTLSDSLITEKLVARQLKASLAVECDTLDYNANMSRLEQSLVAKALETAPNIIAASRLLKMPRSQLYRLMERYKLTFRR